MHISNTRILIPFLCKADVDKGGDEKEEDKEHKEEGKKKERDDGTVEDDDGQDGWKRGLKREEERGKRSKVREGGVYTRGKAPFQIRNIGSSASLDRDQTHVIISH